MGILFSTGDYERDLAFRRLLEASRDLRRSSPHDLLESIRLLANVVDVFCEKCVTGIKANKARCEELVELSMAMVTALAPKIGYDRAAEIAKESVRTGKTVRQLCREKKILPEKELERALDPVSMTEPGAAGG